MAVGPSFVRVGKRDLIYTVVLLALAVDMSEDQLAKRCVALCVASLMLAQKALKLALNGHFARQSQPELTQITTTGGVVPDCIRQLRFCTVSDLPRCQGHGRFGKRLGTMQRYGRRCNPASSEAITDINGFNLRYNRVRFVLRNFQCLL